VKKKHLTATIGTEYVVIKGYFGVKCTATNNQTHSDQKYYKKHKIYQDAEKTSPTEAKWP